MSANHNRLNELRERIRTTFEVKQKIFKKLQEVKKRIDDMYSEIQCVREEKRRAYDEMRREYIALRTAKEYYRLIRDEYEQFHRKSSNTIEKYRTAATHEHELMLECFKKANECYNHRDMPGALCWSQKGREHKKLRDDINAEVQKLSKEIKLAKQQAIERAPKPDPSGFYRARDTFNKIKASYDSLQAELNLLRSERDKLKAEFDAAQDEYDNLEWKLGIESRERSIEKTRHYDH